MIQADTPKNAQTVPATQLPENTYHEHDCMDYFSNRSNYWGPQQPWAPANAEDLHIDLGCGYSGTFKVTCEMIEPLYRPNDGPGECQWVADISTCTPPTYKKALDECYTEVTTTSTTIAPLPPVEPFMDVITHNLTYPDPPAMITTAPPTVLYPTCCEPYVGSVCRETIDFPGAHPSVTVATTSGGKWNNARSWAGTEGFFPMVQCKDQYPMGTTRSCPNVEIKLDPLAQGYKSYPYCNHVCNETGANEQLMEMCNDNGTKYEREQKENQTLKKKIDSMKAQRNKLYDWTAANSRIRVSQTKQVTDCIDQASLPDRYDALTLPKVRSGFDKMPLNNNCRLHKCKVNECLVAKTACPLPYIHKKLDGSISPEIASCVPRPPATQYECVEKVLIQSASPMSLGFGLCWVIIGLLLGCAGIYMLVAGGAGNAKVYAAD